MKPGEVVTWRDRRLVYTATVHEVGDHMVSLAVTSVEWKPLPTHDDTYLMGSAHYGRLLPVGTEV